KTAVETSDGYTLTFSQLKQQSTSFAKKLASLGIKPHSKVAILANNHLDMIICIHALSYLQTTIVFLNTRLTKYELENQLEQSGATFLMTTDSLRAEKQLSFPHQKTFVQI